MEQKNSNFRQFEDPGPRRRKSRFLAVLFGFCPGAGHMYLGKMNRGLSLMALFFGDIALGVVFPPVFFLLPLIWFYAFFDCLNLSGLPASQLERTPDDFGFGLLDQLNLQKFTKKIPAKTGGVLAGWALIIVGVYMLYEMIAYRIIDLLEYIVGSDLWWLSSMVGRIPQMLISVLIIWLGIRLIKGGKKNTDDIPQYRAPRHTAPQDGGIASAPSQSSVPRDTAASVMELIRSKGLDRKPGTLDIMADSPAVPAAEPQTAGPAQTAFVPAQPVASAPVQETSPLAPETAKAPEAPKSPINPTISVPEPAPLKEEIKVELTVEPSIDEQPVKKPEVPAEPPYGGTPDIY